MTNTKLGNDAVTGSKVQNGSLTAQDIGGSGAGGPLAGQVTIDPISIPAGQCAVQTIGLSGVQVGDHVIVNAVTPQATGGYTRRGAHRYRQQPARAVLQHGRDQPGRPAVRGLLVPGDPPVAMG